MYTPAPVRTPRLSGNLLALVAEILEHPGPGSLLARSMLRILGVEDFRALQFEDAPCFVPHPEGAPPVGSRPAEGAVPGEELPEELPEEEQRLTKVFSTSLSGVLSAPGNGPYPTVSDYHHAYLQGGTTPEAVAESIISTLQNDSFRGAPLYAYIARDDEMIRRQAEDSARRLREGRPRSIFEGVPVAIKDELDVTGFPTTVGTAFMNTHSAGADAFVVRRLRAAGAIITGKTNMHEIGIGVTGLNAAYGTPLNPWDPGRCPGGSSSGSGMVVGSALCPVAIGADGGGSVRIPAAFCGVFGLKMTWGRVSTAGEFPLARTVGNNGPLAATAQDLALAYLVTAGADRDDPATINAPPPGLDRFEEGVRGMRIGVYTPWFDHARKEVRETVRSLLEEFRAAGAEIIEIELPELEELRVAHLVTITLEMSAAMEPHLRERRRSFGAETRVNLALARYLNTSDYIKAQQVRARTIARFREVFRTVDVIATPTTANLPPLLHGARLQRGVSDLENTLETMRFAVAANMTGYPAISVPAGFVTPRGGDYPVPVGLQCIGRPWEEPLLLRLARTAEKTVQRPRPAVYLAPIQPGKG